MNNRINSDNLSGKFLGFQTISIFSHPVYQYQYWYQYWYLYWYRYQYRYWYRYQYWYRHLYKTSLEANRNRQMDGKYYVLSQADALTKTEGKSFKQE